MNTIAKYILMFTAGAAVLFSCNKKSDTSAATTEVAKKQQVRVESVYAEDVEQLYEYTAIVQAEAVNRVRFWLRPVRMSPYLITAMDSLKKMPL